MKIAILLNLHLQLEFGNDGKCNACFSNGIINMNMEQLHCNGNDDSAEVMGDGP